MLAILIIMCLWTSFVIVAFLTSKFGEPYSDSSTSDAIFVLLVAVCKAWPADIPQTQVPCETNPAITSEKNE